jgi:hypothetical protein
MSRYLKLTRTYSYSLLFALPLLLLYEVGAVYIAEADGMGLRNGADVLLRSLLVLGGITGTLAVTLMLIGVAVTLIIIERRRRPVPLYLRNFVGMAAESVVYALLLGVVVGTVTQWILQGITLEFSTPQFASLSLVEGIVLSIGAGVYEELVFRVLLVGGLFGIFRWSGLPVGQAGVFSVILASILFSVFHYIGPYGDVWSLRSFLFRLFAGLVFSAMFLLRGFGITAWTHALYDIFVVFALAT